MSGRPRSAARRRIAVVFALALASAPCASAPTATLPAAVRAMIPPGQVVVEERSGDLNGDGRPDRVYLIKGTDPTRIVTDRDRGRLDRNRRGLVIAFGTPDGYTLALSHPDCFSSENEDGGVYFAPELDVSVHKGALVLHYAHGRYGYWRHTFRYRNGDFELVGHDRSENRGPVVQRELSLNLLTRRARIRANTNPTGDGGDERFRETWKTFALDRPIRLRDIADFDEFDPLRLLDRDRR